MARISTACPSNLLRLTKSPLQRTAAALPSEVGLKIKLKFGLCIHLTYITAVGIRGARAGSDLSYKPDMYISTINGRRGMHIPT